MSYCTKCGSEIPPNALFCPTCGDPVKRETAPSPPTSAQPTIVTSSLFDRMIRAARLDPSLYEEVESDDGASTQALMVVFLSSICSGLGNAIAQAFTGHGPMEIGTGLVLGLFATLIGWFVWSFITYFVGTNVFGGIASYGELLRTIGFSNSPGVLQFFNFIPILGGIISFAVAIWGLASMVVAVRQALDFTTGKAILTCIIGIIPYIIILVLISFFVPGL